MDAQLQPTHARPPTPSGKSNDWGLILHLSQFAGYLVPLAGVVAPILIWQMKKEEMPALDEHGKIVINWFISATIYAIIGVILMLVVVGFFALMVLGVLAVVFPIVGAIKAQKGEIWPYPLSIRFFK